MGSDSDSDSDAERLELQSALRGRSKSRFSGVVDSHLFDGLLTRKRGGWPSCSHADAPPTAMP
jgi:hypothetical protein